MSDQHADQGYRKLWATMAAMPPKERLAYFWEYYKVHTIVVLLLALVLGYSVYQALQPKKEVIFTGAVVNVKLSEQAGQALSADLLTLLEGTAEQEVTLLHSVITTDADDGHDPAANTAEIVRLVGEITMGTVDYLLMDEEGMAYFSQQDLYADLRELLTPAQLEQLRDRLILRETEEGEQIPVVIDLAGTELDAGCTTEKGLYIAFPGNTSRKEQISTVLQYLLDLQWS